MCCAVIHLPPFPLKLSFFFLYFNTCISVHFITILYSGVFLFCFFTVGENMYFLMWEPGCVHFVMKKEKKVLDIFDYIVNSVISKQCCAHFGSIMVCVSGCPLGVWHSMNQWRECWQHENRWRECWQSLNRRREFIQTHERFKRMLFFLGQNTTCKFSSYLSSYKTTLKQQLDGEKQWKMKWQTQPLICFVLSYVVFASSEEWSVDIVWWRECWHSMNR